MRFLIIALLALTYISNARADKDRGGGGGFCIENKCVTLAQAGLRIKSEPTIINDDGRYDLSLEQLNELEKILRKIPFINANILDRTIAGPTTFKKVEAYDPKKFEKEVVRPYLTLLKKATTPVDMKSFSILAVSDSSSTYLLPDFFKLDIRGQALTLLHELNIRSGYPLELVVRFDIQLAKYLNSIEKVGSDLSDMMTFMFFAWKVGWTGEDTVSRLVLEKIESIVGRPLTYDDLKQPNRETLIRLGKFDKRIPYALENMTVAYLAHSQRVKWGVSPELEKKCSSLRQGALVLLPSSYTHVDFVRCEKDFSSGWLTVYVSSSSNSLLFSRINHTFFLEE